MIWIEYILFFAAAFGISALTSKRLPGLLTGWGLFDRKSLPVKRPTAGGIAIIIPFLLIIGVAAFFNPTAMNTTAKPLLGLFFASILIAATGFYDDARGISATQKIAAQIAAAVILVASGIQMDKITNPFASPLMLGMWGNVILVIWIIVLTNAVNLIDGIDGLAAGICLISSITMFVIAHIFGENTLAVLSLILAGSLFGFIRYNLPPAKIFLGDTGSLFLGFALAAISIIESRKGTVTVTLLVPVLVLAVPLIDTMLAFFRRVKSGRSPMMGDEEHIHHRLIKLGMSAEQVNLTLYLFCIYLGLTAGVLSFFPKEISLVILVLLAVGILMVLEVLRTVERGGNSKNNSKESKD